MTIDELSGIIRNNSVLGVTGVNRYCVGIGGCEVLEYVVDIPGFVELLRKFKRRRDDLRNFVDDHPDPIGFILGGDVRFSIVTFENRVYIGSQYDYFYRGFYDDD